MSFRQRFHKIALSRNLKMDRIKVARELMKLAKALTADDLTVIADAFTRFCIGDRDSAIKKLSSMKKKPFEGNL